MTRVVDFHLCRFRREELIERNEFYVEQAKKRLLSQLTDDEIQKEAESTAEKTFETLRRQHGLHSEQSDSFGEFAQDAGGWQYLLLSDLRVAVRLSIVAGLFHNLEKSLSHWVVEEIRHFGFPESTQKTYRKMQFALLIKKLMSSGWNIDSKTYYQKIDLCRLIVNVYKHGEGEAFDRLTKSHPEYFVDPMTKKRGSFKDWLNKPSYEDLVIREEHMDDFAKAISEFWNDFPEYSSVTIGSGK